jgi:hypothetical protein
MTDWIYRVQPESAGPITPHAYDEERRFSTTVEPAIDGRWLAVVRVSPGESVCRVFDSAHDALHYGEELAAWLSAFREPE